MISSLKIINLNSTRRILLPLSSYNRLYEKGFSTEIKAEETGGYYKEMLKKKNIDFTDKYYDPFYPYVWLHKLPRNWQPYLRFMRIDQNFGRMLLLNPHLWGIALAAIQAPIQTTASVIGCFAIGSIFAHAASCAWDDYADVEVDRKIPRTQLRPLVAGILPKNHARLMLVGLLTGTFGVLSQLSPTAITFGLIATPCVFAYPYMKQYIQYPQVFLAFALNLGVFMGFGAVMNSIDLSICLPAYLGGVCHTIFYDSIYAFQDVEEDKKAGTMSTSQVFAYKPKIIMSALGAGAVLLNTLAGFNAGLNPSFLAFIGMGALFKAWQVKTLNIKNAPICDMLLNVSYKYGLLVFIGYLVGALLGKKYNKKFQKIDSKKNEPAKESIN